VSTNVPTLGGVVVDVRGGVVVVVGRVVVDSFETIGVLGKLAKGGNDGVSVFVVLGNGICVCKGEDVLVVLPDSMVLAPNP
jgi:hypothetical protein